MTAAEVAWFLVAADFAAGVVVVLNVIMHRLHTDQRQEAES